MSSIQPRRIKAAVSYPLPLIAAGVVHTLSRDVGIEIEPWSDEAHREADVLITDPETALALAADFAACYPFRPRAKLAVIAHASRESEVRAALEAGIHGYLLAKCSPDELVMCVRMLSAGSRYLSDAAMRCVADSLAHEKLTPREVTVLELLAEGLGNKAIANRLDIGLGTVKSHVVAILDKLGASNRTQAVTVASARGLLSSNALPTPPEANRPWWQPLVQAPERSSTDGEAEHFPHPA